MPGSLFISYSSEDRAWVHRLAEGLRAGGWEPWVDHPSIAAGSERRAAIVRALQTADAFVVVLSPASVKCRDVAQELSLAEEFGRRIVPLQLAAADEGPELTYQLAGLQRIAFFDQPFDRALHRLLFALDCARGATVDVPALHDGTLPGAPPPTRASRPRRPRRRMPLAASLVVALLGAALWSQRPEPSPSPVAVQPVPRSADPTAPPAFPAEPAPAVSVTRLVIAHDVVDSEPRQLKRGFRTGAKVYAFTELQADGPTTITHRYTRGGDVVHTSELDVQTGRFRTWSYVTARDPGAWRVVVTDAAGATLSTQEFKVH